MLILLCTGVALIALSAGLLARAGALPRSRAAVRLQSIGYYGFAQVPEQRNALRRSRPAALAARVGALVAGRIGAIDLAERRRELRGAGHYRVTPEAFTGCQVLAAAGLGLLGALYASALPGGIPVRVAIAGVAATAGALIPQTVLQRRARARLAAMDRELPELMDLLVVTVEAGVAFTAALQMCTRMLRGPLGEELRLVVQEQSMGLSTDQALANLLDRCDTSALRSFVRALQHGERLGLSIGSTLRNQALEQRQRRRHAAEERAQKSPVKMLFPLVFLILPSMFIVLLGPAGLQLSQSLGSL